MARLFTEERSENATHPSWCCTALDGELVAVAVRGGALRVEPLSREALDESSAPLLLVRTAAEGGTAWVALARGDVALNGRALRTRVAVLADRDELRIGGLSAFASFERLPALELFECAPGAREEPTTCPRCKTEIESRHWTVVCPSPSCGVRHHQDEAEGLPCWLDVEQCALCSQPTPLDAGITFDPGEL